MLKVFADNIIVNNGISRIEAALKKYASERVEFVDNEKSADLVIIYAYGQRRKVEKRIKWVLERGQKYAIVQIALRSTANPDTRDWIPMWEKAKLVWSYYPLRTWAHDDGFEPIFNFYYAPLGVDSDLFRNLHISDKSYKAVVGDSRDESVSEVIRAAKGNVFHLGTGLTDEEVMAGYNISEFVSGLRRKEGFEMPVLEGLLCGARPICYDQPHYRHWFDGLAEFIPESHPEEVTEALRKLFAAGARPVTDKEQEWTRNRFNWQPIVEGFWSKL